MKANVLFEQKVHNVPPQELQPASYNPRPSLRATNPEKFKRLKRSIEKGLFKPVLVNRRTGNIVAGHQRVEAAIELGIETVPVLYLDVPEKEEKRINIADNVEWSAFEKEMIQQILSEEDYGDDLELFGFDDDILSELSQDLGTVGELSETDVVLGEKKGLEQITFVFTEEQSALVMQVINYVKETVRPTHDRNHNKNGLAAFHIFAAAHHQIFGGDGGAAAAAETFAEDEDEKIIRESLDAFSDVEF